jgi:hypothetical protein
VLKSSLQNPQSCLLMITHMAPFEDRLKGAT